ncbi:hypothetical protein [Opitutus terrae]|uniref:Uncharacterized protein n=1 Tax=Opitutus terrae (strain DSM 11246 / JCM 15787 / PB90-1) TaxID=452637 RepID=B1ZQY5_OPITP|nr:hypothetical protein [Opitutus terrae]ACB73652.1 hypothetical protein Oter_0362 [Opitutus terrae PB90-1]
MIALPVFLPNRRLDFTATGDVLDPATNQSVGRWSAESSNEPEHNSLVFFDDAGARQVIRVHYGFNDRNQLTVSLLPADGVVTEKSEATFNGWIAIDDEHDVIYSLADGPNSDTGQVIVVYGDLRFDGPKQLVVDMTGGDQTSITSDASVPLAAEQNTDVALAGRDLLVFHASTTNTFGEVTAHRPAEIKFAGQWKLWPEGLRFECSAEGDLKNPDLMLSLKGRCKAVAAGLEFRLKDGDAQALLVVEGKHTYDAGSATWSIAVGYNQLAEPAQRIKASAKGKIMHTSKAGNLLTIEGSLSYQGDGGAAGTLELAIDAEYEFAGGKLVFKAVANWAGSKLSYDLQLGGELTVRGGKLVFDVSYSATNTASVTVNYTGSDDDFLRFFNVSLKRDASGKIKAGVKFGIELSYINGVQVSRKVR